jgi:hypothetical protein
MIATLVLSGTSRRLAADGGKGPGVGSDPVAQCLRPAGFGVGEVRGAHDGDKDLRRSEAGAVEIVQREDRDAVFGEAVDQQCGMR